MAFPAASEYDVAVVGAGPAGAACATLLARAGVRVALISGTTAPRHQRAEVCTASTLRLIRHLDLPMPGAAHGARGCRGVLSRWAGDGEQFFDYELYACGAATTIARGPFDVALVAAAGENGAAVAAGVRRVVVERRRGGWRIAYDGGAVLAGFLVDASGRGGGIAPHSTAPRRFTDRLVAFSTPHRRTAGDRDADILLLEATAGGWWYVTQDAGDVASVVYLSDVDLVPRSNDDRVDHHRRTFAATGLVRDRVGEVPDFTAHRVSDARTSERIRVAGDGWLAIGDAALSIDPLSGEGLRLALASAEVAATAIAAGRASDPGAFRRFSRRHRHEAAAQRRHAMAAYQPAAKRFPLDPFWQRRSVAPHPFDRSRSAPPATPIVAGRAEVR